MATLRGTRALLAFAVSFALSTGGERSGLPSARAFMRPGPVVGPAIAGRYLLTGDHGLWQVSIRPRGEIWDVAYGQASGPSESGIGLFRGARLFVAIGPSLGLTVYRVAPDGGARGDWTGFVWAPQVGQAEVDPPRASGPFGPLSAFEGEHAWRSRMPGQAGGFVDSPHALWVMRAFGPPRAGGVAGMRFQWGKMLGGVGLAVGPWVGAAWAGQGRVTSLVVYDLSDPAIPGLRVEWSSMLLRDERLTRLE